MIFIGLQDSYGRPWPADRSGRPISLSGFCPPKRPRSRSTYKGSRPIIPASLDKTKRISLLITGRLSGVVEDATWWTLVVLRLTPTAHLESPPRRNSGADGHQCDWWGSELCSQNIVDNSIRCRAPPCSTYFRLEVINGMLIVLAKLCRHLHCHGPTMLGLGLKLRYDDRLSAS